MDGLKRPFGTIWDNREFFYASHAGQGLKEEFRIVWGRDQMISPRGRDRLGEGMVAGRDIPGEG